MPGSLRLTRLRAAGAFLIAVLALIPVLLSGGTAHAATSFSEIQVGWNQHWCITALNYEKVGSELVLGVCASATSQEFSAELFTDTTWELVNEAGLCITFDMANGGPDGAYALLGICASANNQLFSPEPAYDFWGAWVMPNRVDNLGRHVALDNEGNNLKVNNHIDESYYSSSLPSESWYGPAQFS